MEELNFKAAFKYPFNKASRMFNVLWVLLPIIGWFALGGYGIVIVKNFIKGNFKELPEFEFGSNLSLGFFMFIKAIPLIIATMVINYAVGLFPFIGSLGSLFLYFFIIPMLVINFFNKETIMSCFEFKVIRPVFENFVEYVIVMLKSLALGLIFLLMYIILVGIPANAFTKNIFLADFYGRYVK